MDEPMDDIDEFEDARFAMVETQLVARGITDARVLAVMRRLPRHRFVDPSLQAKVYEDHALAIGNGQTISQPYMVAVMTEALGLTGSERVLEVGTGSGYQTAVLAELSQDVYSIERMPRLADRAEQTLKALGYTRIHLKVGDGTLGWRAAAPFDAIVVTAGAPAIPTPLIEQLAEGGQLAIPIGARDSQILTRAVKQAGTLDVTEKTPCVFVPLLGAFGWQGERRDNGHAQAV